MLQQARDLMAQVREGFVLSVRSTQAPSKADLRFLLERVLHDWGTLSEELGLETGQSDPAAATGHTKRKANN